MSTYTREDRAWFAAHPEANMRLRLPREGEVEELALVMFRDAKRDLEQLGGVFPPPAGCDWWLMVTVAGNAIVRLLVSREKGVALKAQQRFSVLAVALGDRVAVDAAEG